MCAHACRGDRCGEAKWLRSGSDEYPAGAKALILTTPTLLNNQNVRRRALTTVKHIVHIINGD